VSGGADTTSTMRSHRMSVRVAKQGRLTRESS
jgi:hypothetical protein